MRMLLALCLAAPLATPAAAQPIVTCSLLRQAQATFAGFAGGVFTTSTHVYVRAGTITPQLGLLSPTAAQLTTLFYVVLNTGMRIEMQQLNSLSDQACKPVS